MEYRLQSMYYPMVGWAASVVSLFYFILLALPPFYADARGVYFIFPKYSFPPSSS